MLAFIGLRELLTNERNTAAVALYQHMGFAADDTRWQGGRYLWLQRTLDPA